MISCLGFRDPENTRDKIMHCGENVHIIESLMKNDEFAQVMADLRNVVKMNAGTHPLHIVFFCGGGKHRSVAIARCASFALEAKEKMQVLPINHLSRSGWKKFMCPGTCALCEMSPRKNRALESAAEVYDQLSSLDVIPIEY